MNKKVYLIFLLFGISITVVGFYLIKNYLLQPKSSKVLVEQIKYLKKGTTTYTLVPIAELPKEKKQQKYDILEGKVSRIPMNTSDPNSPQITVIIDKNNEVVVLTNHPYVTAITKFYIDKEITLKGRWKKETIIYGRKYKNFWVEDYQLKLRGDKI
ncbi:MAG: hypothetical protein RMJ13_06030 [Elusimicrobiota bacterium]|nr:hypothetical protein [Elusimicrobiota bacterium]